jgi:hypothetical protein
MSKEFMAAIRQQLLTLARLEDERAAAEAALVPYWSPVPASVQGHREAARLLREDAQVFLVVAA